LCYPPSRTFPGPAAIYRLPGEVSLVEITERLVTSATPSRLLAAAALLLVAAFCWCWRHRCRRKTVKEVEQQRHEQRMELLQEYGRLLFEEKLAPDDLPLIARLERSEPSAEIEPPAVNREAGS
jgi:hypothetical protein